VDGATFPFDASRTLYAVWAPEHTVTYDANGGSWTMAPTVAAFPQRLAANAFVLAERDFAGWNTQSDGGGDDFADAAMFPFDTSLTLYAQWVDRPAAPPVVSEPPQAFGDPLPAAVPSPAPDEMERLDLLVATDGEAAAPERTPDVSVPPVGTDAREGVESAAAEPAPRSAPDGEDRPGEQDRPVVEDEGPAAPVLLLLLALLSLVAMGVAGGAISVLGRG
jgi:hypothetical protein